MWVFVDGLPLAQMAIAHSLNTSALASVLTGAGRGRTGV